MRYRLRIRCAHRQPEVFIPRVAGYERTARILARAAEWYAR